MWVIVIIYSSWATAEMQLMKWGSDVGAVLTWILLGVPTAVLATVALIVAVTGLILGARALPTGRRQRRPVAVASLGVLLNLLVMAGLVVVSHRLFSG